MAVRAVRLQGMWQELNVFSTVAILRDSLRTRQGTVERHEGQSQKETPPPLSRRIVKAASTSLLGNRQSYTPEFGSLWTSRTSQAVPESHGGRSQQETRMPSPHRLTKAASMSLLGNRPQFGSLLALVTSQMTAEKDEFQLRQETRPPSFHQLVKAASMSALGDRRSPTTQFRSLLTSSLPSRSGNHVPRPRPFPNSYWVTPLLVACEYPWTPMLTGRSQKIDLLLRAGVRTFIDLTESGELCPYQPHLAAHVSQLGIDEVHEPVEYYSFPIPDRRQPRSVGHVRQILEVLKDNERRGRVTAMHCRGGISGTGLVVGCWLVESGMVEDGAAALKFIDEKRKSVEDRPSDGGDTRGPITVSNTLTFVSSAYVGTSQMTTEKH